MMSAPTPAMAQSYCADSTSVLTSQYNSQRTGTNWHETCLTSSNVPNLAPQIEFVVPTPGSSGCPSTDNPVYTQPLYVYNASVEVEGEPTSENVVVVTTLNDQVFLFDAINQAASNPCYPTYSAIANSGLAYWSESLINDLNDCGGSSTGSPITGPGTALPFAGVLSTPVVYGNTVYAVGGCKNSTDGSEHWYLHGLSLLDGSDTFTAIDVGAGVYVPSAGGAYGASGSTLAFAAQYELQRAALALAPNGEIFIAFGIGGGRNASEYDPTVYPYHGWLIGYPVIPTVSSTANFAFASTPNVDTTNTTTPCTAGPYNSPPEAGDQNICGLGGGIWMSGKGPAMYTTGGSTYIIAGSGNGGVLAGGSLPSWALRARLHRQHHLHHHGLAHSVQSRPVLYA